MSLPKKGSRIIEIETGTYRWLIRKKPTYDQGLGWATMTVAIESVKEDEKSVLLVNTGIYHPDNWVKPNQTAVTPSVIRKMILAAINDGWEPGASGPYQFNYQLTVDGSED
ncbi:MAG: hypothetical protein NXI10_09390 [bacterium]|nr:hypothetical protein [bacterium]